MGLRRRRGQWHYRFQFAGQEYSGSTGLPDSDSNREAAEAIEAQKRRELCEGTPQQTVVPFDVAAAEFVTWCEKVEYRRKPNTARRIKVSFSSMVAFFKDLPVSHITPGQVERYKTNRIAVNQVRDVTVRHDLHALSVFFRKYAKKMQWATANPVEDVSIPSDVDAVRIHPITAEEEAAYFGEAFRIEDRNERKNLYDVAKLMLNQGCRPEEIMALAKEDVDFAAGTMTIRGGKTRAARRTLKLTAESQKILETRASSPGRWLFPSDRRPGRHITQLQYSHDKCCTDAKVSFCLYDFRHTFGTRMGVELKEDPFTLAAIMGHSSLRTIMRYVHPQDEAKNAAMERYEAEMQRRKLKVVAG